VTAKHYVQPGTLDGECTERLVQMLDLKTANPGSDPASLDAEQLLSSLPAATLARLIELVGRTSQPQG
jgi:hypothetical protein